MKTYYNPDLKKHSRELRKNATFSEKVLWKKLRSRQLLGYQFMRQKPIDNYIVDFYCSKLKLIIEIDGITHHDKQEYDKKREDKLRELGFEIMRFDGFYILNNTPETLQLIVDKIKLLENKQPPNPLF
jgi:very-short-patch-repair endonuclease